MPIELREPYTPQEYMDFIHIQRDLYYREIVKLDKVYALFPDEIVDNWKIIKNPEYDKIVLNEKKMRLLDKNNTNLNKKLFQGVVYKDISFDSDVDQKINLLSIYSDMSNEDTIVWYGKDNDELLCTKEDLRNIGDLIKELHTYCWTHNAEIKQQIEQAQTLEELDEIDISYDKMDNK